VLCRAVLSPGCLSALQDVVNEAVKWGGKVLLHQEVGLPAAAGGRSTGGHFGLGFEQSGRTMTAVAVECVSVAGVAGSYTDCYDACDLI
jgi:hypothetical protein